MDNRTSVVIQYRLGTLLICIATLIASGCSAMSDVYCRGLNGRSDATINGPVRLLGLMAAAGPKRLTPIFNLLAIDALMAWHLMLKGWLGCMIHRVGQSVQHTLKNDARMGQFGGKELIAAASRASRGWTRGVSSDVDV